jgi:hypothetical protein
MYPYTFRVFVTTCSLPVEEIWHDYNRGADMENRIVELKDDLAADDYLACVEFFATAAAFYRQPCCASKSAGPAAASSCICPPHAEFGSLRKLRKV